MTPEEECYLHFVESIDCFNRARRILYEVIESEVSGTVMAAAQELALIEYAKPYKTSYGKHGRHALERPALSTELAALHREILDLRDQVLAHGDLTIKEAKVHATQIRKDTSISVVSNIKGALPAPKAVIELIERSLDIMYARVPEMERQLEG